MAPAPSLYVHVPFCASRCSYCDFHTVARGATGLVVESERWLRAIERHLVAWSRRYGLTGFNTVYIGGGTPSWLPRDILVRALAVIGEAARAGGSSPVEWSVEANPEDVDAEFLGMLSDAGVNRLSVGVQSLEDAARGAAGRRGSADDTEGRLESLAGGWGQDWSADLMFGLPGQTVAGAARDAARLAGLGAGHVSLYELTLEEGTPLCEAAQAGKVRLPDQDERADLYESAAEVLKRAGFARYEVSNWARPGNECAHNEVYWDMGDWLAVGPSGVGNLAAGRGEFLRFENSDDDAAYALDPSGSAREYAVAGKDAAFECLMTALRTARGFDLARFDARFGVDPVKTFGPLDESFPELVRLEHGSWIASDKGLDMLNVPLVSALSAADAFFSGIDENGAKRS